MAVAATRNVNAGHSTARRARPENQKHASPSSKIGITNASRSIVQVGSRFHVASERSKAATSSSFSKPVEPMNASKT